MKVRDIGTSDIPHRRSRRDYALVLFPERDHLHREHFHHVRDGVDDVVGHGGRCWVRRRACGLLLEGMRGEDVEPKS